MKNWHDVAALDELDTEEPCGLGVEGKDIALYWIEGQVYATDNICTHGYARLCDGYLEGHEIECPLHQGRFDVRDGRPLCSPLTKALTTYPVRIEGGRVWLQLDTEAEPDTAH